MPHIRPKSVTIISGFLGAGKTTFLNEYIKSLKGTRPFIIENEFGKEGIDAGLIMAPGEDVFELNSGCLCCNLNEDFFDLLEILWERNEEFDELLIETTGIADPAAVAQPFLSSPHIENYYKLQRVICIVDAQLVDFELEETEEARKQIAFADIILINKSNTVRKEYLAELEMMLRNINPFATILSGNKEEGYPLEQIMKFDRRENDYKAALPEIPGTNMEQQCASHSPAEQHKEHHHHNISSLSFVFEEPFNLQLFEHRLLVFLNFQAKDIYRVKGFIRASDENHKIIVQSVANLLAITPGETCQTDEKPKSRLVFIGRNLKAKGLQKMLEQCLDKHHPVPLINKTI